MHSCMVRARVETAMTRLASPQGPADLAVRRNRAVLADRGRLSGPANPAVLADQALAARNWQRKRIGRPPV